MPLFKCSRCSAVENTAMGAYWYEIACDEPVLCSECATGKWHGEFDKKTPEQSGMIEAEDGFLYKPAELESGGYFHGKTKPKRT